VNDAAADRWAASVSAGVHEIIEYLSFFPTLKIGFQRFMIFFKDGRALAVKKQSIVDGYEEYSMEVTTLFKGQS